MGDQAIRVSPGVLAVYPTTERKGRAKQIQIVLKPSSLELHKNEKYMKNNKPPKHLIELGDLFNISLQNEPNQIKNDCICLMSTETTYFILPNDTDSTLNDWFELLIERVREARSIKVLRPVFREEFFEAAWDITIVKKPKLRKDYAKTEKIDDLAEKLAEIQGRKRLCISATCFLLFKMGVHPTSEPDQPFDKETYTELPINVISNYGKQERFFFVRVGRCSEIGQGELWMSTEGGASATQLHDRISKINQRDAEKRRQQGIVLSVGGLSSRTLKSTLLRQRARENRSKEAAKKAGENVEGEEDEGTQATSIEPIAKEKTPPPPEPTISVTTPSITSPKMSSTKGGGESSKLTTPKKKVPFADMFKIGNKFHNSSSSSSASGMAVGTFTANPEYKDANDQSEVQAYVCPPPTEESEPPPPRALSPRNYYSHIAEDYMSYDAVVDSRKASAAYAVPLRQTSVMSGSESTNNMATAVSSKLVDHRQQEPNDYLMMTTFKVPDEIPRFPIKEARSYVSDISDSNESCYSSAAKRAKRESTSEFGDEQQSHGQRAFSLGSKPPLRTMPISRDLSDLTTQSNPVSDEFKIEDIRKRAHSAGSKTWTLANYNRKVSEAVADSRNRTNSFGTTGTNALTAIRRQRQQQQQKCFESDDHAVIDFSDNSNKGSMASIDSPSVRSRNSSIGVQSTIRNAADIAVARQRQMLETTAEKLAAIKVESSSSPRGGDSTSASSAYGSSSSGGSSKYSSSNRRGSAPESAIPTIVAANDSDYVPMPCKSTKQSRYIGTIMENIHSSSEPSSPEPMDDEDDPMIHKRAYVAGTTLNQGGLEYALIVTSSAGPTARSAPPPADLPIIQSFAPSLPPSITTSSSAAATPPPIVSTATHSKASPKQSSVSPNHCEYTVINPTNNK